MFIRNTFQDSFTDAIHFGFPIVRRIDKNGDGVAKNAIIKQIGNHSSNVYKKIIFSII